jgi:hypothetical protein
MIPTFIVWVIKARLFDHARIGKDSLLYSGIVTIAGGCVVVVASFVNVEIFQRIVDLVRH